jgi:hypothetical protein
MRRQCSYQHNDVRFATAMPYWRQEFRLPTRRITKPGLTTNTEA